MRQETADRGGWEEMAPELEAAVGRLGKSGSGGGALAVL